MPGRGCHRQGSSTPPSVGGVLPPVPPLGLYIEIRVFVSFSLDGVFVVKCEARPLTVESRSCFWCLFVAIHPQSSLQYRLLSQA